MYLVEERRKLILEEIISAVPFTLVTLRKSTRSLMKLSAKISLIWKKKDCWLKAMEGQP